MNTIRHLLLVIVGLFTLAAAANGAATEPAARVLAVPSVISDGMVFQQQRSMRVWGWAPPGTEVTVRLQLEETGGAVHNDRVTADTHGKWIVELPPMDASFLQYQLLISNASSRITVKNILVGEVWLAGGQSNMQLAVPYIIGGDKLLAAANNPHIRIFNQNHIGGPAAKDGEYSRQPLDDVAGGGWQIADSAASLEAKDVSGIAYTFALALFDDLNKHAQVPVAILNTAVGATGIQTWLSPEKTWSDPLLAAKLPKEWTRKSANMAFNQPTVQYNYKIAALTHLALRGFLWSQGESDVGGEDAAAYYRVALKALIEDWRDDFDAKDAPFIAAQLAPHFYSKDLSTAAGMREAQIQACEEEPNAIAIPIQDVSLVWNDGPFRYKNPIHPLDKAPVGQRMALAARAMAYDEPVEYIGPRYQTITVSGARAILSFSHVGKGLKIKDGDAALQGFAVCGSDRKFAPAEANIVGETVEVSSPAVSHPVAVTYGYTSLNQQANLFNASDLPASPFRTDKIRSEYWHPSEQETAVPNGPGGR